MMADVGDLLTDIAQETRQSPEDLLRLVHGRAARAAAKYGVILPAPAHVRELRCGAGPRRAPDCGRRAAASRLARLHRPCRGVSALTRTVRVRSRAGIRAVRRARRAGPSAVGSAEPRRARTDPRSVRQRRRLTRSRD
jgi:hypothetical protein